LAVPAVHCHTFPESGDFFRKLAAGFLPEAIGPFVQNDAYRVEQA